MAQKVLITLVDDIDGGEAAETIIFALDGTNYEIDVNEANAKALRAAVAPFAEKGRKIRGGTRRNAPARSTNPSGTDPKQVRAWAKENGIQVPERGRIPAEVQQQYLAAN